MIRSFKSKETQKLFYRERCPKLPPRLQRTARRKLLMVDAAKDLNDLKIPPGNQLEKMKGNRRGMYSIRINDQWRICFEWKSGDAYNVEITDYH